MKLIVTFLTTAQINAFSLFGMDKKNPFYAVKPKYEQVIEPVEESDQLRKMTGPENVFKFQQVSWWLINLIDKK